MHLPAPTGKIIFESSRRKQRHILCLPLLALLALSPLAAQPADAVYQNPRALAVELRRLERAVHDGHGDQVLATLPGSWSVRAGSGHSYTISSEPLRKSIDTPDMAETWLSAVANQLESYGSRPATRDARAQLNRILTRSEFSNVRPQSPVQLYWQSFRNWLLAQLDRLFSFVAGDTIGGKILFVVVAIAAIVFLEIWLLGLWRGKRRKLPVVTESPVPVWTWQKWAVAAREAADRGDSRTAIHCCYWAGVVRLQDLRCLPGDLTHTPREFLRLLPAHDESYSPLAALTGCLERIWYANRAADATDLDQSFSHLEKLGCRL